MLPGLWNVARKLKRIIGKVLGEPDFGFADTDYSLAGTNSEIENLQHFGKVSRQPSSQSISTIMDTSAEHP